MHCRIRRVFAQKRRARQKEVSLGGVLLQRLAVHGIISPCHLHVFTSRSTMPYQPYSWLSCSLAAARRRSRSPFRRRPI